MSVSQSKPNPINPEDLYGDELFYIARDMSNELKDWLDKYEPCFGQHEILQTIKRLQGKLESQLSIEENLL